MAKGGFSKSENTVAISPNTLIGIVRARFNDKITTELEEGAVRAMLNLGLKESQVIKLNVPGAIEIPVAAKALLQYKKVDAVIALGAVIRGETTHYESVCNSVERGCTHLALEFIKPVISGVLTVENEKQAWDRLGGSHGHKGEEAGVAALEMVALIEGLK